MLKVSIHFGTCTRVDSKLLSTRFRRMYSAIFRANAKARMWSSSRPIDRAWNEVGTLKLQEIMPIFVTCVWHTHVIFWKKRNKRTSTKEYCYFNRSLNQAGTLFRSIDSLPECSGSSVQSISHGRSSGILILECHSGKCGLHSPLSCPNWTDDPTVVSWEPETAKNRTGLNQEYKGRVALCQFACWPPKLP